VCRLVLILVRKTIVVIVFFAPETLDVSFRSCIKLNKIVVVFCIYHVQTAAAAAVFYAFLSSSADARNSLFSHFLCICCDVVFVL